MGFTVTNDWEVSTKYSVGPEKVASNFLFPTNLAILRPTKYLDEVFESISCPTLSVQPSGFF